MWCLTPPGTALSISPSRGPLGNALDWNALMKLADQHAIRFLHVCVCTNGADPFHMTLWEGVPLREIVSLVSPKANVRRVYYQSYHPADRPPFQASLPLGQVLETPPGQMPVTLAYKMNGQFIPASQGGPVRMMVPGAYGSKQIKWVQRLVFTSDYKSNDSDAELNNDTESAMKTRARFIHPPNEVPAAKPVAITGMAQVGISGLRKVQYSVHSQQQPWPAADPHRTKARWIDAAILPPPSNVREALAGQTGPARETSLPVADALCPRPLGRLDPRFSTRQLRPLLPHHRRQRRRPAPAPHATQNQLQRHPPRRPHREGITSTGLLVGVVRSQWLRLCGARLLNHVAGRRGCARQQLHDLLERGEHRRNRGIHLLGDGARPRIRLPGAL